MTLNDCREYFSCSDGRFDRKKFQRDSSEFKEFLLSSLQAESIQQLEFRLRHGIYETPVCPACGRPVRFTKSKRKFSRFCSRRCSSSFHETIFKRRRSCLEKHGDETFNNHDRQQKTMLERYGIKSALCPGKFRKAGEQTRFEKYGSRTFNNPMLANSTGIARYGTAKNFDKIRKTMKERHGVDSYLSSPKISSERNSEHVLEKIRQAKELHGTFNASASEDSAFALLKSVFGDIRRQFKSDRYPFCCDFYVVDLDLYIQCNFHWTHGGRPFNPENPEDMLKLNAWKRKGTKFYLNAIKTWTSRDPAKRRTAKTNGINYLQFWTINNLKDFLQEVKMGLKFNNLYKMIVQNLDASSGMLSDAGKHEYKDDIDDETAYFMLDENNADLIQAFKNRIQDEFDKVEAADRRLQNVRLDFETAYAINEKYGTVFAHFIPSLNVISVNMTPFIHAVKDGADLERPSSRIYIMTGSISCSMNARITWTILKTATVAITKITKACMTRHSGIMKTCLRKKRI